MSPVDAPLDVSVIVPAYRAGRTLGACVASLLGLQFGGTYEVILALSADAGERPPELPADPRLTVLASSPRLSAAAARNLAAKAARGRLLVFTDADAEATPGWLDGLVRACEDRLCVAGSVINGTPGSAAGTTEYLVQFLDLHPRRPPASARHGATCNLLVPRPLWERCGPFPEDLGGGEDTLLTTALRAEGLFRFAPEAAVVHLNRTSLREVLAHQVAAGRFAARLGRRGPHLLRPLIRHVPLAPLASVGRLGSLYLRLAICDRRLLGRAVLLSPLIVAALSAWGAGLATEGARLALRSRPQRLGV